MNTDVIKLRVEQGLAPGGIYVHVITGSGETLTAFSMVDLSPGDTSVALADEYLTAHPEETVFTQIYDGDTGRLMTIGVAFEKDKL